MGQEARCSALLNGSRAEGKALLETDALVFRGDERATILYKDMRAVQAKEGRLTITWTGGTAIFDLGTQADKWAHRIRNPKNLMDKLGVKQDHDVVVLGVADHDFVEQLGARAARVSVGRARRNADAIFYGASKRSDLSRLEQLKGYLKPDGSLWVVRPRGGGPITESDVMARGRDAGLVDVKVVRFSETHTAEKFVIPTAARR
jgi:hypothetical protein